MKGALFEKLTRSKGGSESGRSKNESVRGRQGVRSKAIPVSIAPLSLIVNRKLKRPLELTNGSIRRILVVKMKLVDLYRRDRRPITPNLLQQQ